MAYTTQAWIDGTTPMSAANMNNLIEGIDELRAKPKSVAIIPSTTFEVPNNTSTRAEFTVANAYGSLGTNTLYLKTDSTTIAWGFKIPTGYTNACVSFKMEWHGAGGTYRRAELWHYRADISTDVMEDATAVPYIAGSGVAHTGVSFSGRCGVGDDFYVILKHDIGSAYTNGDDSPARMRFNAIIF
jgi:hypothetical protein